MRLTWVFRPITTGQWIHLIPFAFMPNNSTAHVLILLASNNICLILWFFILFKWMYCVDYLSFAFRQFVKTWGLVQDLFLLADSKRKQLSWGVFVSQCGHATLNCNIIAFTLWLASLTLDLLIRAKHTSFWPSIFSSLSLSFMHTSFWKTLLTSTMVHDFMHFVA